MSAIGKQFHYPELVEAFQAKHAIRVSIILHRMACRLHQEKLLDIPDAFVYSLILPEHNVSLSYSSTSLREGLRWMSVQLDKYIEIYGDTVHAIPRIEYKNENGADAAAA